MNARVKVLVGLTLVSSIGVTSLLLNEAAIAPLAKYPSGYTYLTLVTPSNLDHGDFYTAAGTRLHFNEDGVVEGGYIEIAPLGGLYLTTPINGLENVEIDIYRGNNFEENFTFAWCSAPYEAMEAFDGSRTEDHDFSTEDCTNLPPRYFCITNPSNEKYIRINTIAIRYRCISNYDGIAGQPLVSASSAYDDTDKAKTLSWSVISSETAHVDFFDRGYNEEYLLRFPGTYPVAYTVYSASSDHAFQYSTLASYTVRGMENGQHAVTFHDFYDHAHGDIYPVTHGQDYTGTFPANSIWDAPINDFTNVTEDRHYYAVMSAFGFDPNGHCSPVTANWYINEGHVEMPAPDRVDEGYRFVGWFKNPDCTTPYNPNETSYVDLTLYAKVVKTNYPVRAVHYYDVDRNLSAVDYVTLDQVSGDSHYGYHRVRQLYDNAFCYNAGEEPIYVKTSDNILIQEKAEPVVILTIDDPDIVNNRDYHIKYRSETVTGDTFYTATHFSDRVGYREKFDPQADVDRQLPALPFHIQDGDTFKTITSTDGYIYPYARRNTYLDDLDALTEIGAYAYACYSASSAKPLYGLSGHNRVNKVGRRAFFNRFGLADHATYFPAHATIFDTEAYANVFFNNNIVILPNTLQKIGARCFMGCQNLNRVYLPVSLTSVGANAFGVGTFDEQLDQFVNVHDSPRIDFYYQGTEAQYHALPLASRQRIEANARSIKYEVTLNMHAPTDYFDQLDWPYTQKYLPEETL